MSKKTTGEEYFNSKIDFGEDNINDIEDYDRYDEDIDVLDDEDIEILETRNKNEDFGEKSVGIVSDDLWGDWGKQNLTKKERKKITRCVGFKEEDKILPENELKKLAVGVVKSQSSNYYSGVLNNHLRKSNLFDKFRMVYINGYYYGYDLKNKTVISLLDLIKKLPKESKDNIYIKALYNINTNNENKTKKNKNL